MVRNPQNVILLEAEEHLESSIVPRLTAAGADLSRIRFVKGAPTENRNRNRLISIQNDAQRIEALARQMGDVGLIVVSPITSYLGSVERASVFGWEDEMFNGSIYVRNKPTKGEEKRSGSRKKAEVSKPRRLPPEVLTNEEVAKLMRTCSHRAPTGIRNRALIALLYRSGLRINEALTLYPKDLELDKGMVRVLNGKGGRSRTIGIDPGAATIVQRWLDKRSSLGVNGRHPDFCTLDGEVMSASYVRVMLKRLAFKAGIEKRVHAHGCRHTHAAQLRAEGVDIAIISRQLGHTNITTTARYLDHIAPTAVIETIRNRRWMGA